MKCRLILKVAVALAVLTLSCFILLGIFKEDFALVDRIIIFAGGYAGVLSSFFAFDAYYSRRPILIEAPHEPQKMESLD